MTAIAWKRVTREQAEPVKLGHADYIGLIDGRPFWYLTRTLSGRWNLWRQYGNAWAVELERVTSRSAKAEAQTRSG